MIARNIIYILFHITALVIPLFSSSSSISSSEIPKTLIDMIAKHVTYDNRDPKLDYFVPEVVFTAAARRPSGEEVNGPDPDLFLGSGKYGGVYLAQSKKSGDWVGAAYDITQCLVCH